MSAKSDKPEAPASQTPRSEPQEPADRIGENLRRAYDEVVNEPLPDRFNELLEKLKKGGS